ncbi:patatin-like protein, partial [Trifolium medium]|nr:patatin-like protein [Trifolium medium]
GICGQLINITKVLTGAKYNGEYLHKLIRNLTNDTFLSQTLTNVVIPSFDVEKLQPTIFSSYQIKVEPTLDVPLTDICIATSAAPTYLPAHYFEKKDEQGAVIKTYNLIDGGVCANNPVKFGRRGKKSQIVPH